jgi:histidyl-tRNA synthetase
MKLRNQYKNPSGVKDYFYNENVLREKIIDSIKKAYKRSGFLSMETSILNNTDILSSKYGGGAEILKEMYTLSDQGDRDLALRYDLTVPFVKYMAMNPTLKFPIKRYEIGKVFRNGPVKKGRLREFTQCDMDILGVSDILAEAELLQNVMGILENLGLEIKVEINNIKIIYGLLEYLEVGEESYKSIVLTLDKQKKITSVEMVSELVEKGLTSEKADWLLLRLDGYLLDPNSIKLLGSSLINDGYDEIERLKYLLGKDNVVWNPYLARGLEIYTGSIYEVFIENGQITSSVASGGRYDSVIGEMLNGKMNVPAVGISIGLDVILDELLYRDDQPERRYKEGILIIPLGTEKRSLEVANILRNKGYVVEVEMIKKTLSKALKYADSNGYASVLIIGEEEEKKGTVKLRNLVTRTEKEVILEREF